MAARSRLHFVDACRGAAVLAMLLANFVNVFLRRIPSVLTHNQGDRLRAFDLPAPAFQFLIGVSLVLFLDNRTRRGRSRLQATRDAVRRFVLLILLGTLLDCVGALHLGLRWGVLQTLGLGGIVAALLAGVPDAGVAAIGLALLGAFSGTHNGEVHANPLAALAFAPLTLAGMLVGRPLVTGRAFVARALGVAVAAGLAAAALHAAGIAFNKVIGTSSFVALATAVSAAALLAAALVERAGGPFPAWLLAVGSNALTAWVLQYLLVYYPAWIAFPEWHRLSFIPGLAAALASMAGIGALTIALGRRGIRIPI